MFKSIAFIKLVFLVLAKNLELTPLKINYAKSVYSPEIPWHGCCTEEKTLLQFQAHYSMDNCQEPVDRCHWNRIISISKVLKGAMSRMICGLILKSKRYLKINRNLKVIIIQFVYERLHYSPQRLFTFSHCHGCQGLRWITPRIAFVKFWRENTKSTVTSPLLAIKTSYWNRFCPPYKSFKSELLQSPYQEKIFLTW